MKKFVAEEKHIIPTLHNFGKFCSYIDQKKPKLSQRLEELGKNDLFRLNSLLTFRQDFFAPNYLQASYPFIDLMFKLSLLGGLYRKTGDEKANVYLESTSRKEGYDKLNSFEQYCFLFETFWTKFDFTDLMRWDFGEFDRLTSAISKSRPGQELVKGSVSERLTYDPVFSYLSAIVHYFRFLGICSFEPIPIWDKKPGKPEDTVSKIIPNEFGIKICSILRKLKLKLWNKPYLKIMGIYTLDEYYYLTEKPFLEHFKPIFPENSLLSFIKSETSRILKGNFTFKVMLGNKIWRKIKLSNEHTLEDLHLCIQRAFNFDDDHLYSFFMDGKKYSQNAYHSPNCNEGPYVDDATLGKLELHKGQKITYFFDYSDSWEFKVQLVDIAENEKVLKKPEIIETKGEAPPQYPFEEDWEEDFEEDEEDNENSDETPDDADNE